MANARTFDDMVNKIVETAMMEPEKRWRQEDLCEVVTKATGYKSATINLAIKTLVISGRLRGEVKGAKAYYIQAPKIEEAQRKDAAQAGVYKSAAKRAIDELQKLKASVDAEKAKIKEDADTAVKTWKAAAEILEEKLKEESGKTRVVEVQLKRGDKKVRSITGMFHEKFERILKLAQNRKNIFIYGPTGCGKTHICAQVAEALDLRFAFVSCTSGMSEGAIGGRLLPVEDHGKFNYVASEFITCYEQGGVFLLDEIDAADANVLLMINAALANGRVAVSNRVAQPYAIQHPDFVCIAAANTVGTGADRLYTGRNKLDMATLDRFAIGKVFMDYDVRVEEELCPDQELRARLMKYRKGVADHRLERAVSSRFMRDAYDMVSDAGWSMDDVDAALFEGWRADERNKVTGGMVR